MFRVTGFLTTLVISLSPLSVPIVSAIPAVEIRKSSDEGYTVELPSNTPIIVTTVLSVATALFSGLYQLYRFKASQQNKLDAALRDQIKYQSESLDNFQEQLIHDLNTQIDILQKQYFQSNTTIVERLERDRLECERRLSQLSSEFSAYKEETDKVIRNYFRENAIANAKVDVLEDRLDIKSE